MLLDYLMDYSLYIFAALVVLLILAVNFSKSERLKGILMIATFLWFLSLLFLKAYGHHKDVDEQGMMADKMWLKFDTNSGKSRTSIVKVLDLNTGKLLSRSTHSIKSYDIIAEDLDYLFTKTRGGVPLLINKETGKCKKITKKRVEAACPCIGKIAEIRAKDQSFSVSVMTKDGRQHQLNPAHLCKANPLINNDIPYIKPHSPIQLTRDTRSSLLYKNQKIPNSPEFIMGSVGTFNYELQTAYILSYTSTDKDDLLISAVDTVGNINWVIQQSKLFKKRKGMVKIFKYKGYLIAFVKGYVMKITPQTGEIEWMTRV